MSTSNSPAIAILNFPRLATAFEPSGFNILARANASVKDVCAAVNVATDAKHRYIVIVGIDDWSWRRLVWLRVTCGVPILIATSEPIFKTPRVGSKSEHRAQVIVACMGKDGVGKSTAVVSFLEFVAALVTGLRVVEIDANRPPFAHSFLRVSNDPAKITSHLEPRNNVSH